MPETQTRFTIARQLGNGVLITWIKVKAGEIVFVPLESYDHDHKMVEGQMVRVNACLHNKLKGNWIIREWARLEDE